MLLWQECRAAQPGGYRYTRFCELYDGWERRLSPTMRRAAVRRLCWADRRADELIDGRTGELCQAQEAIPLRGASTSSTGR